VLRFTFDMLCLPVIPVATRNNSLAHDNKTFLRVRCRSLPRFRSRQRCEPDSRLRIALVQGAESFQYRRRYSTSCHQVKKLSKTSRNELDALLMDAHARLQFVPPVADTPRVITLARFGSFEVRLIQPISVSPTSEARFWMELFDHDRQLSIDSVGNLVLEDAAIAAEHFIAHARKQGENPHEWRRST
jgi:hypothetical protein